MNLRTVQIAKKLCRELRKRSTESEKLFWNAVRNKKLDGKKFYRQYPLFFERDGKTAFVVADFYCHERRLVIEIDGKRHDYQKDYDELRTDMIKTLGINVLRFKNEQIENNVQKVLMQLKKVMMYAK